MLEDAVDALLRDYHRRREPIEVRFRDLVTAGSLPDRATHMLHPYPAKLLAQIPLFFLATDRFSRPGELVLDPFCGSGTVLVEALIAGRNAIGADANPFARFLAEAKTEPYALPGLHRAADSLEVRLTRGGLKPMEVQVVNKDLWFYPHVALRLQELRAGIDATRNPTYRKLFSIAFAVTMRKLSLANPRLSVPVRLRADTYPNGHWYRQRAAERLQYLESPDVHRDFRQSLDNTLRRVRSMNGMRSTAAVAAVSSDDARSLRGFGGESLPDGSASLVLTSPPYPGAQKYVRASSLAIGWLRLDDGLSLRALEERNIGREHYRVHEYEQLESTGIAEADAICQRIRERSALRAHIAATYLLEMRAALRESVRALASGGHLVLISGANRIAGEFFDSPRYLSAMLEELGLVRLLELRDAIHSRGLMTRRNKTAGLIDRELVSVFLKP